MAVADQGRADDVDQEGTCSLLVRNGGEGRLEAEGGRIAAVGGLAAGPGGDRVQHRRRGDDDRASNRLLLELGDRIESF